MALEAECQMHAVNDKGLISLTYKDFLPISETKKLNSLEKQAMGTNGKFTEKY